MKRIGMNLLAAALLVAGLPAGASAQVPAAPAISPEGMVGPALYVTDPARSLKFYTEGLGMKLRMRFGPVDRPDMVVGFGPNPAEAGIMLITDKTGPIRPIAHAHGFDRIALRMPDLAGLAARLKGLGFKAGEVKLVHGSIRMMMVTDPDGYRLELIETPGKPAS